MRLLMLLMLVYLVGVATLAINVDQRFFINDALAIVIFVVLGIGLLLGGATGHTGSGPSRNG